MKETTSDAEMAARTAASSTGWASPLETKRGGGAALPEPSGQEQAKRAGKILGVVSATLVALILGAFEPWVLQGKAEEECLLASASVVQDILEARRDYRSGLLDDSSFRETGNQLVNKLDEMCSSPNQSEEPLFVSSEQQSEEWLLLAVGRIQGGIARWKIVRRNLSVVTKRILTLAALAFIGVIGIFLVPGLRASTDMLEDFSRRVPVLVDRSFRFLFSPAFWLLVTLASVLFAVLIADLLHTTEVVQQDLKYRKQLSAFFDVSSEPSQGAHRSLQGNSQEKKEGKTSP